jgi:hypothetical protein
MRTLRASELGSYLFCQRAWWYQCQGVEPLNKDELAGGTRLHQAHGRQVLKAGLLGGIAWLLLLAGLVLLIYSLAMTFL